MKLNFLLIDDSSIELLLHSKHIEHQVKDAEVMTFIRAKMALEYLNALGKSPSTDIEFVPHIILVDLDMPEMNGIEFLSAFSEFGYQKFQKTKLYMMSSTYDIMDIIGLQNVGASNAFFRKPLSKESIQYMIEEQITDSNQITGAINQ